MAQRIFIKCRSNHDPINIGGLACQQQLGRPFNPDIDHIRWAGNFEPAEHPRKCQVLVDSNVNLSDGEVPQPKFACYEASTKQGEV
jgi:hypothetical protein